MLTCKDLTGDEMDARLLKGGSMVQAELVACGGVGHWGPSQGAGRAASQALQASGAPVPGWVWPAHAVPGAQQAPHSHLYS